MPVNPAIFDRNSGLPEELAHLPFRILFQNEFVSLVLVGLKRGQELLFLHTPLMLLTVAYGRMRLLGMEGFITLCEGGQRRLESGARWQMQALSEADLLFFIPAVNVAC